MPFWDVTTGRERGKLDASNGRYMARVLTFSPDGKRVATTDGSAVSVWEIATGAQLLKLHGGRSLSSLTFAPDGKILAAGDDTEALLFWDAATGKSLPQFASKGWRVAFAPDGKRFAQGDFSGSVSVRERGSGKEVRRLAVGEGPDPIKLVEFLAFSPDGKTLFCAGRPHLLSTGCFQAWDLTTGARLRARSWEHWRPLALSQGGSILALSGSGLWFWDLVADRELSKVEVFRGDIGAVGGFAPDGKTLVSAFGRQLRFHDAATGKELGPPGHRFTPDQAVFSRDGRTVAAGDTDATVRVWEAATGKELWRFRADGRVNCLAYSADSRQLAAGAPGLRLWDLTRGQELWRRDEVPRWLAFSPDGKTLAAATREAVGLWDVAAGTRSRQIAVRPADLAAVAFARDGKRLLGVEARGRVTVRLWEAANGKAVASRPCLEGLAPHVRLAPDGSALTVVEGNKVRFTALRAATAEPLLELPPHYPDSPVCALSGDGRTLAVGRDRSETLSLWELASGQKVGTLKGAWPEAPLTPLAFSPDGGRLLSESGDGTLLVWDLAPRGPGAVSGAEHGTGQQRSWDDLAGKDAPAAYRAIWALAEGRQRTVAFLKERLRPAHEGLEARIRRLIKALDTPKFAAREAAMKQLREIGAVAEAHLRDALERNPPLEVQRRLRVLVDAFPPPAAGRRQPGLLVGEPLRTVRAIQVLERIGTPAAREVLRSLARGEPEARETREAKAALERLAD
jgi:WD40 repeat protein